MLEEYDRQIMDNRDTAKYRHKGKETMKRYKDYDGVKQKLKTYSKKTGLKYKNMGC